MPREVIESWNQVIQQHPNSSLFNHTKLIHAPLNPRAHSSPSPDGIHPVGERLLVIRREAVGSLSLLLDLEGISLGKIIIRRHDALLPRQHDFAQGSVVLGALVIIQFIGSQHEPPPFPEVESSAVLLMQPSLHDDVATIGEIAGLPRRQTLLFSFAEAAAELAEFRLLFRDAATAALLRSGGFVLDGEALIAVADDAIGQLSL